MSDGLNSPVQRATPADVHKLAELSDIIFRATCEPGTAMGVEFAPMFSAKNAQNLYFVEQDGKPVSLVGIMPGRVAIQGVSVSVASMGSVCTLADYRRHHYASQMVEQVVEDFSKDTSLLLVSGALSIYRRVGCVDFGEWIVAELDVSSNDSPGSPRFDSVHRDRPQASSMLALYRAEPFRFSRSLNEMKSLVETLGAPKYRAQSRAPETFIATRDGSVVAYAIAHQFDRDPTSIFFMEWAGDRTALPELADAAKTHFGTDTVRIAVHPSDQVAKSILSTCGAHFTSTSNAGTLRVLNVRLLLDEIGPLINEIYGARLELTELEKEVWTVSWHRSSFMTTNILPDEGKVLSGPAELSTWLFHTSGLNLPFPRTDDLNFI